MAGETTAASGASMLSSLLSTANSAFGFVGQLFSGASGNASATKDGNVATSMAEADANKKNTALATNDQTEAMLAEARIAASRAEAASPNDPYYGRPVA